MDYGVCDEHLTGSAWWRGWPASAGYPRAWPSQSAASAASAAQRLLALLYAACAGGGCLRAVDALGADRVVRRGCGLRAGPPSRRLGASLQRMHRAVREGLQECARLVSRRLTPLVARDCVRRWGSVPVFVDGPAIEVEGRLCEHAERRYHGERQSWLHAGGPDGQGDGREQLDRDVAPLLAAQQPVGLRAASAYSCQALGSSCRQRGWDDSVSVTDPRQKALLLRQVAARELREDEGEPLRTESRERAVTVAYQPARGPEEQDIGQDDELPHPGHQGRLGALAARPQPLVEGPPGRVAPQLAAASLQGNLLEVLADRLALLRQQPPGGLQVLQFQDLLRGGLEVFQAGQHGGLHAIGLGQPTERFGAVPGGPAGVDLRLEEELAWPPATPAVTLGEGLPVLPFLGGTGLAARVSLQVAQEGLRRADRTAPRFCPEVWDGPTRRPARD